MGKSKTKILKLKRNDLFWILLLILLALYVRIYVLSLHPLGLYSDAAVYMSMARYFYEGNFPKILHIHWQPFYPMISSFFYPLFHNWAVSGYMVSAFFGSLLVLPVYLLIRSFANQRLAILSGLYIGLFGPLVGASTQPLAESLLTFFIWTGLFLLWQAINTQKPNYAFGAGVFWALGFLTKSEGFLFFLSLIVFCFLAIIILISRYLSEYLLKEWPIFLLSLAIFFIGFFYFTYGPYRIFLEKSFGLMPDLVAEPVFLLAGSFIFFIFYSLITILCHKLATRVFKDSKKIFLLVIPFVVGYFLTYAPYKISYEQKFGKSSFLAKVYAHINLSSPLKMSQDGSSTWAQDVLGLETADPKSDVFRYPKRFKPWRLLEILATDAVKRAVYFTENCFLKYFNFLEKILFVLGAFWLLVSSKKRQAFPFFFIILSLVFIGLVFLIPAINDRKIYFLLPIFPIIIVLGIQALADYKVLYGWYYPIFILIFLVLFITKGSFYFPHLGLERKEGLSINMTETLTVADLWFLENHPGARIMAVHEGTAFYSRCFIVYPPEVGELPDLVEYAKKWKVEYLIALAGELPSKLDYLYREPRDYNGLKLVFNRKDQDLKIYKIQ